MNVHVFLDIVSLFTNIPLAETIQLCLDTYQDETIQALSISEETLRKLLFRATTGVEFSFNGVMYRHMDGVPMGSPLNWTGTGQHFCWKMRIDHG